MCPISNHHTTHFENSTSALYPIMADSAPPPSMPPFSIDSIKAELREFLEENPAHIPKKPRHEGCVKQIKKLLSKEFTKEELVNGGMEATTKTYKGKKINCVALSPNRLRKVFNLKKTIPDYIRWYKHGKYCQREM